MQEGDFRFYPGGGRSVELVISTATWLGDAASAVNSPIIASIATISDRAINTIGV